MSTLSITKQNQPLKRAACVTRLVCCIAFFGVGANTQAQTLHSDGAPTTIRVMSFNVRFATANDGENHWERRKELLIKTIKNFAPDLLGTQETLKVQRDFLAERFAEYETLGVGRDDGKDAGEMMAIYYRRDRFEAIDHGHFWLSETPNQVGSKSWDSSLPRMVTWVKLRDRHSQSAEPILFLNTHYDHRGEEARVESAKVIVEWIRKNGQNCRVVITGDFNAGEGSAPYQVLFSAADADSPPLRDTYRVVHPDRQSKEGTFNGFRLSADSGPRIDWIAVSSQWKILEAGIDRSHDNERVPSDHFPITAVLK